MKFYLVNDKKKAFEKMALNKNKDIWYSKTYTVPANFYWNSTAISGWSSDWATSNDGNYIVSYNTTSYNTTGTGDR